MANFASLSENQARLELWRARTKAVRQFFVRTAKLHPGYDFGSTGTLEEQAEFGCHIIEYFQEMEHMGWEGFRDSFRGMSQIMHLIADIERFLQECEQQ